MNANMRLRFFSCATLLVAMAVGLLITQRAESLDRLYITSNDGSDDLLLALDGLPIGNSGIGQAGDTYFRDAVTNNTGLGPIDTGDNGEILVGGEFLQLYDADLNFVTQTGQIAAGAPATAVEIGSLGPATHIVATHDLPADATQMLYYDSSLNFLHNANIPNFGTATSVEFGNLSAANAGNEIAISGHNETYTIEPGFVWMGTFDGSTTGFLNQSVLNASTSDLAFGNLFGGATDDYVITGAQPDTGGSPTPQGQGTMAFSGGSSATFEWSNALANPHGTPPAGKTLRAVVTGDVFTGAVADPDGGNEIIAVGNDIIRILSDQAVGGPFGFTLQEIPLNNDALDVVLADVLHDDGVDEIVVITGTGLVIALEHAVQGDTTTNFIADPMNNIGAAYDTGRTLFAIEALEIVTSTDNADFDGSGFVDGNDFLIWQRNFGLGLIQSEGDADGDMDVDNNDLIIWQNQYGSPPLSAVAAAVPEPASLALLALVGLLCCSRRKVY